MDIVGFALWKFRNIEGVLCGMHPVDVTKTRHEGMFGEVTMISYDYAKEIATIEGSDGRKMTCTFYDLPDTLRTLGMYKPKPMSERHGCTVKSDKI